MNSIVICTENVSDESVNIEGVNINVGLVETKDTIFDTEDPRFDGRVLVKKIAFTCNYRDKSNTLQLANKINKNYKNNQSKGSFSFVGSEFVGTVVETGKKTTTLKVGDKVIIDGSYPYRDSNEALPGLPTNGASAFLEVFHETQLVSVPATMPSEVAASFSIGAQTIYSMLRKLKIKQNSNVLITSAKSNTSLFALNALRNAQCNVYCLTSSEKGKDELSRFPIKEVSVVDFNNPDFRISIAELTKLSGGFDYVIDPFADVHFFKLLDYMNYNAKYIFCGVYGQHELFNDFKANTFDQGFFIKMIRKNISLIANCLGSREDLLTAIHDYEIGKLDVIIDSVHDSSTITSFFNKSFNGNGRMGKVVYKY